jgi:holliday junction DNA helicase RuvB
MLSGDRIDEELSYEVNLRPRGFDEYIGQEQVKANLQVAIAAARGRGDVLDHILFHGPPGLGKTSLAYIIAREMGSQHPSNFRAGGGAARRPRGAADQSRAG